MVFKRCVAIFAKKISFLVQKIMERKIVIKIRFRPTSGRTFFAASLIVHLKYIVSALEACFAIVTFAQMIYNLMHALCALPSKCVHGFDMLSIRNLRFILYNTVCPRNLVHLYKTSCYLNRGISHYNVKCKIKNM